MKKQALHVVIWKEARLFVARFLEIELASQGKTKQEALQNLHEAFALYMEDENSAALKFPVIGDVAIQNFPLQ